MKTALSVGFVLATAMLLAVSAGVLDHASAQAAGSAHWQAFVRPAPAFAPLLPAPATAVQLHEGAPSATAEAAALLANTTIFSDDFEGSFPGSWQLYHSTGTESTTLWGKSSYRKASGSYSAWCAGGGSQPQPAGGSYVPNMGVWLEYGPFDLSDASDATIEFDLWSNVDAGTTGNPYPDKIGLYVSTDDFNSNGSGFYYYNTGQAWQHETFNFKDVTSVPSIGAHQVYIAFIFTSDATTQYEGAYIDNVTIRKTTGGASSAAITYWVPVVSHKPGLYGSQWRSDLGVLNAGSATATLTLKLYAGSPAQMGPVMVAPGAQAIFQDVAGQMGITADSGALEVGSDQPVFVTSRTYNQAASGTFGQDYNSFTPAQGYSTGQVLYLPQLTENAAYRTNIGVTNIGTTTASATVGLYSSAGTKLNEFVVPLAPGQFYQDTQPFKNRAGQTDMTKGYAKLTVTQGSAVIAYASVIDNSTSDPTTIPMKQAIVGPTDYWVPVVSHKPGLYSSQWRSDLGVLNIGSATANLSLKFYPSNGSTVLTAPVTVAAGAQAIFQDVAGQLGITADSGALEVVSDQPVYVTSRTYNQATSGTFGQDYNSFTTGQAYSTGQVLYLPQLTENAAYRTNIGVTNIGAAAASVTVGLYSGAGTKLNEFVVPLAAGQFYQDTQPFQNRAGQTNMTSGYAKLTVTQGSAVIAYASVIDNSTSDPTTIPMKRGIGSGVVDPLASATWIYTSVLGQLGVKAPTLDTIVSNVLSSGGAWPSPLVNQLVAADPTHRVALSNGIRFDYGAGAMVRSAWVTGSATLTYSNANITSSSFSANYAVAAPNLTINGAKYPITSIAGTVSATQSITASGTALEEGLSRVVSSVSQLFGVVPLGTKTVADLTVNGTGSSPTATETGSVHFDTSLCRNFPVSGSIVRTIGSDRYVFTFTNKCDSSFTYGANPPALSCTAGQQVAGGDTPDSRFFEMGRTSATFQFDYETYSQEDQIQIVYEGRVIFDTGCVGANGTVHPSYSGTSSVIQVNVTPNCAGGTGTSWNYQVHCP